MEHTFKYQLERWIPEFVRKLDQRFQRIEQRWDQRLDEILARLKALEFDGKRNCNNDRLRLRENSLREQSITKPVSRRQRHQVYVENSIEEDYLLEPAQHDVGFKLNSYINRDNVDFNSKVHIPTFNENLIIEQDNKSINPCERFEILELGVEQFIETPEETMEAFCDSDTVDEKSHINIVRHLTVTHKQGDDSQRHKLFRTRCTIDGQIFDVIIDSGSCENVIGKSTVERLGLTTEKHPSPYTIGWITAVERINVTERCKVQYSIGKYKDEAYFDVVDMDACHLLFGRPWQYDVAAVYNCRDNTYKLEKDGRKINLLPLKAKPKASKVKTDTGIQSVEFPEPLEFKEAMPTELPNGVPPIRDIQHHIDLVPSADLSNLPHHQMSPKENEIVIQKEEEVLKVDSIQENMSSGAVSTLLTPKKDEYFDMVANKQDEGESEVLDAKQFMQDTISFDTFFISSKIESLVFDEKFQRGDAILSPKILRKPKILEGDHGVIKIAFHHNGSFGEIDAFIDLKFGGYILMYNKQVHQTWVVIATGFKGGTTTFFSLPSANIFDQNSRSSFFSRERE